jgi:hypothetical protein
MELVQCCCAWLLTAARGLRIGELNRVRSITTVQWLSIWNGYGAMGIAYGLVLGLS